MFNSSSVWKVIDSVTLSNWIHLRLAQPLDTFFFTLFFKDGSELIRCYTPVTGDLSLCQTIDCPSKSDSTNAQLHFLIKIYSGGPFTSVLDRVAEGETIEVSDPSGNFVATQLEGKSLVAIAAGTGITPMVRLIVDALRNDR